jgi:spore coat protein CotH
MHPLSLLPRRAALGLVGSVLFALGALNCDLQAAEKIKAAHVFQTTNIWTVHLKLTSEQWEAMEPKQGERPAGPSGGGFSLQGPEGGRNGLMSAFGVTFNYVHADLELGTNVFKDVGVRYKGNGTFMSSARDLKRSLKIDLNQFVKDQKFAGMSQLNLHNSVRDPAGMNETIAYRIFREGGVPAPRTAYAKVFVTVPGKHDRKYFGLYDFVEDVGKDLLEDQVGDKKGALLKPVTPSLFSDLGDDWKSYNQTYDPKGTLTDEQKKRVIDFSKIVAHASDEEFLKKLPEFIDLENFARYMALTVWLVDLDGILGVGQNYYVYLHPQTRKFMFIPWDQDQTWGQFARGTNPEQRETLSIQKPWQGQNRFLERVFKSDDFKTLYLARLKEFDATILKPEPIRAEVDQLAKVLRPAIEEESPARLKDFDKAVAGESINISTGPGGFGGSPVKPIKAYVGPRGQSVRDQLAGKSEGYVQPSGFGFGGPPPQGGPGGPPRGGPGGPPPGGPGPVRPN